MFDLKIGLSDSGQHFIVDFDYVGVDNFQALINIFSKIGVYKTKEGYKGRLENLYLFLGLIKAHNDNINNSEFYKPLDCFIQELFSPIEDIIQVDVISPVIASNMLNNNISVSSVVDLYNTKTEDLFFGKQFVSYDKKGVSNFTKAGIENLFDLLTYAPVRYVDRTAPTRLEDFIIGEKVVIVGRVVDVYFFENGKGVTYTIDNNGKTVKCSFFYVTYAMSSNIKEGVDVLVEGKVSFYKNSLTVSGSNIEPYDLATVYPIVPVYKQKQSVGITQRRIMCLILEALSCLQDKKLVNIFKSIHFPPCIDWVDRAVDSLARREISSTVFVSKIRHLNNASVEKFVEIVPKSFLVSQCLGKNFPFELTVGQKKAIEDLDNMLSDNSQGRGVIVADVGSGKTIVSLCECVKTVDNGFQACFVAPTSILARQIYDETVKFTKDTNIRVLFYDTSKSAKELANARKLIQDGLVDIVVSTHSVFGKKVKFSNLGLVVIDEQQKFGVEQRQALTNCRNDGVMVNIIEQSATPIPQTVANILYNTTCLVEIKDKPKGRLPIVTSWIQESPARFFTYLTHPVFDKMVDECGKGNKCIVVAPVVFDDNNSDAANVESVYKQICSNVFFDGLKCGFVHGKQDKSVQQETIDGFKNGDMNILVASSVVEVGVDVKNASVVVILSPDRMGASSLHQIRGRVGRSSIQGYCFLVSNTSNVKSCKRLQSLVDSQDGFEIAKVDFMARGGGDLFGSKQSGSSRLRFFDPLRHASLVGESLEFFANKTIDSTMRDRFYDESLVWARSCE